MPKVGEGWVEVTTRVDQTSLRNAQRTLNEAFDDIEVVVGVDIDRTELAQAVSLLNVAFDGIVANIQSEVDRASLARTVRTMDGLVNAANIRAGIGADVNQASVARARAQINSALSGIDVNVRINTNRSLLDRIFQDDNESRTRWVRSGQTAGSSFVGGFLSQIANAFELSGPIGGAIILGIAGLIAAIAVPLGAMLGGLITVAFGGAAGVAAAIVGGIDSPEVSSAFERMKNRLKEVFIDNETLDFISTRLAALIDTVTDMVLGTPLIETVFGSLGNPFEPGTKAFSEFEFEMRGTEGGFPGLVPNFESILTRGIDFLEKFVLGIVGVLNILVPAFDRFINSEFAVAAFDAFVAGMIEIAAAVREGWDEILKDESAQRGMVTGIQDFFALIRFLIGLSFDLIRFLSRTWDSIRNEEGPDGRTDWDKIRDFFGHLGSVMAVVGAFFKVLFSIWRALVWDNPEFWEFLDNVDDFLDGIKDFLEGVAELINFTTDLFGGEQPEGDSGPGNPAFGKAFKFNIGQAFQEALNAVKQGGWSTLGDWFEQNVFSQLPPAAQTALQNVGTAFTLGVQGIRTGEWSGFASWMAQNVFNRLPPSAQAALNNIGTIFSLSAGSIRSGSWSQIADWFVQNVWNRLPGPAQTAANAIGNAFTNAGNLIRGGVWSGMASWFINSVANPIASGLANAIGGIPRTIEGIGGAVRNAIVNVINGAIGRVRGAISVINALPFVADLPMPSYIGYALGGWVGGPPSMVDSVPALLATGEFVVNAQAAQRYGPMLEAINAGRPVSGGPETINVYVDGVKVAHRATVLDSHRRVIQHLGARAKM